MTLGRNASGRLFFVAALSVLLTSCPAPITLTPPPGSSTSQMAATPTFSPTGGLFTTDQSVTVTSATSGASIYYTTDGTVPTTSSTLYSGPVSVSGNGTYKVLLAIAAASGSSNSGLAASTFKISHAISTFAGNGYYTGQVVSAVTQLLGDNGAATLATFYYGSGLAIDSSGDIFVADTYNQRIRMITPTGTISTVAGTGASGSTGDGAAATAATLSYPTGLAIDASNNIYVADTGNSRIRRFSVGGNIVAAAGTGANGNTGDGSPATGATFNNPMGLAVDSLGNIFVADVYNYKIRKFTFGGNISTYAGNGHYTGQTPLDVLGDGGSAASATFYSPYDVAVDASGNLFIADYSNYRVREVVKATGVISTIAGGGKLSPQDGQPATSMDLFTPNAAGYRASPGSITTDASGNVYFMGSDLMIHKIDTAGIFWNIAGGNYTAATIGDGGPAMSAQLNLYFGNPQAGIVVNKSTGALYFDDNANYRIRRIQ